MPVAGVAKLSCSVLSSHGAGRNMSALAQALAFRWLAEPWTEDAMRPSARELLELTSRTSVTRLVRGALTAFPRPPHGEPSVLARWLERTSALRTSHARKRAEAQLMGIPLPPVRRWPVAVASAPLRSRPFAVDLPITVADVGTMLGIDALALDKLVDRRQMGARASSLQSHYTSAWLRKRAGGARLLEAPKWRLRGAQRALLDRLLARVPVHEAAHGFVRGRSIESFVAPHVGRPLVVRMDLEDFFGSIHGGRVRGVFRQLGCSDEVATTLSFLTTTATPARILRSRPHDPREPLGRLHAARTRLRGPHLPQGAPTSPALSNLVAFRLDLRLSGLATKIGARYTRYADDLAFSFDGDRRQGAAFEALVTRIAREEGFAIAPHKTRWMRAHQRQLLSGLVVNVRAQVPRETYDGVRAVLHRASTRGLGAVDADVRASILEAHINGRAAWAATGSRTRRRQIQRALRSIDPVRSQDG